MEVLNNNFWPSWYPNKKLGSRDLVALEDFLISQLNVLLQDRLGHGIVSFCPSDDLAFTRNGKNARFDVKRIEGLTPTRRPVIVDMSPLTLDLELLNPDHTPGFDICIDIENNETKNEKRSIKITELKSLNDSLPTLSDHLLYLGRYATNDNELKLQTRPWVYTLTSITDDKTHPQWILPLQGLLEQLVSLIGTLNINDPIDNSLSQNILHLAHHWLNMPIAKLEQQIFFVSCLYEHRGNVEKVLRSTSLGKKLTATVTSNSLPQSLASIWANELPGPDLKPLRNPEDYVCTHNGDQIIFKFATPQKALEFIFPENCVSSVSSLTARFGSKMITYDLNKPLDKKPNLEIDLENENELRIWPLSGDTSTITIWPKFQ